MKKLISLLLILMLALSASMAFAATEPNSKTIEETTSYETENLKITIDRWCYAFNRTECRFFVADIVVSDPAQLRTAFAGEKYTASAAEATSEIAMRHDAALAINGDYYNFKDNYGMIIRNGELYRDKTATRDQLLVYADGRMEGVLSKERGDKSGKDRIAEGVVQSFEFGPLLVRDGQKTELPKKYIINTKDTVREPRTGIGQVDETHYVVIVADGRREGWSDKGMTLQEMQQVFIDYGCHVGYNLDGGGSATMIMNGERVNKTSGSRERNVSDIIYFAY
ncbi:MAG: phosphodiester glycosidase family protein [Clostridia bacterium]|nr:phosphodiester glycosidase family protein [Clostridia bacterium]